MIPHDQLVALIALYIAAFAGMFAHFAKKLLRDELPRVHHDGGFRKWTCHLWRYLAVDYPQHTAAAILTVIGACMGVMALGQLHTQPIYMVIGIGFGCGWVIDSGVNRT